MNISMSMSMSMIKSFSINTVGALLITMVISLLADREKSEACPSSTTDRRKVGYDPGGKMFPNVRSAKNADVFEAEKDSSRTVGVYDWKTTGLPEMNALHVALYLFLRQNWDKIETKKT